VPVQSRLESCLSGILFLGCFLYLWKGIGPHLLYYGFGVFAAHPTVLLEGSFLRAAFSTPGGPAAALAALLAQSYAHAWLGALIVTAVLGVLFAGIRRLLRFGQAGKFRDLAWVPVLSALTIFNNYYENPLPVLLTVGLSIWAAVLHEGLAPKAPPARTASFLILFCAVYYLAGAAALVFAVIAFLTEALLHRRVVLAIVQAILTVGGVLVLGRFVFGLELASVFTAGTSWDPDKALRLSPLANWLALVLHTFVPSLILVALLDHVLMETQTRRDRRHVHPKKGPQSVGKSRQIRRWQTDSRVWVGLRLLAVVVTAVLCLAATRTPARHERALHYHAQRRDWDQVLALAGRMRSRHRFTRSGVFEINRALAHRGRLGSELFAFPQDDVNTLFMTFDDMPGRVMHAKSLELYLDLGCLNAAEKNAYELLAQEGPTPHVLEALVRIHLAKGQYESARVVFEALRKCVGCRRYVRRWQSLLADPARAETDPLIQSWRRVKFTQDGTSIGLSAAALKTLLQAAPDHRLAFEYLMACHLLKNEQTEVIDHLSWLRPLGYTQLPHHYAEALLVHSLKVGTPPETQGWDLDPDLQRQFAEIRDIVTQARGNDQAAFQRLVPKYGDTYMFYSMFHLCGLK
jgi:hypothetical protein